MKRAFLGLAPDLVRLPGLVVLVAGLALAAPALAAGDAQAGHALAQRWCSGCHVVDRGPGPDSAPPFPAIAQRNPHDHGWVRAWLAAPHPPMPDLHLSRREVEDVVAYLDSLSPP